MAGGTITASASGREELRALAEVSRDLFESRHQIVKNLTYTDAGASAEIGFHAFVANDLPNGLKAGHKIELDGRTDFEFRDGLISRIADIS